MEVDVRGDIFSKMKMADSYLGKRSGSLITTIERGSYYITAPKLALTWNIKLRSDIYSDALHVNACF